MTWVILTSVVFGILLGHFFLSSTLAAEVDLLTTYALTFLLLCIGIDIGANKKIFKKLKDLGFKILILPFSIAAGSIVGAVFTGILLGLPVNESSAVGAGFGWYSLSGVLITQIYNEKIGALAFITNVFRELIAIIVIPITADYLGKFAAIAPGGATTMDTTLPVISKTLGRDMVLISFISGAVLSMLVPVLVPILIKL